MIDMVWAMRHRTVNSRTTPLRPTGLAPLIALMIASAGLSGCEYFQVNRQTRGNMVDPIDYSQLVPGTSTRADVTSLIGTPTTKATFDDNTWIYIGEQTQPRIGGFPQIDRQHKYTAKNAVYVSMDGHTTPSPGSEASILQQVIGNVGRYNPAGLLGGAAGQNPNGSAGGEGGAGNTLP
jgi:outer membrane protein assembly factor BamE (lipoprotein component of BamABCDE complex)